MHKSQSDLSRELKIAKTEVLVGECYVHYKDQTKTYKVIDLAVLEADDSVCVIYKAQYGEHIIFVRPLASWLEQLTWSGKTTNRFRLVK